MTCTKCRQPILIDQPYYRTKKGTHHASCPNLKTGTHMTLLELAMKNPPRKSIQHDNIGDQHIELVIAWLRGSINLSQVSRVLGRNPQQGCYVLVANFMKEAYRRGFLIENPDAGRKK